MVGRVCCCGGGEIRCVVLKRWERRWIRVIECASKGIIHFADVSLPFSSPTGTGASVVVVAAAMGA